MTYNVLNGMLSLYTITSKNLGPKNYLFWTSSFLKDFFLFWTDVYETLTHDMYQSAIEHREENFCKISTF